MPIILSQISPSYPLQMSINIFIHKVVPPYYISAWISHKSTDGAASLIFQSHHPLLAASSTPLNFRYITSHLEEAKGEVD